MVNKATSFRLDADLSNRIDKYIRDSGNVQDKSDFFRAAIIFYLNYKEKQFSSIPEEIINSIAFLMQIVQAIQDLNAEREFVEGEVIRLWQMAKSTPF